MIEHAAHKMNANVRRALEFAEHMGLGAPILLAPMAGVRSPALSISVGNAGGMAACSTLLMTADDFLDWAREVRADTPAPFQLNSRIPDPPPPRDPARERAVSEFLERWGPPIPAGAADATPPDFDAHYEAMLAAKPAAISSVIGL